MDRSPAATAYRIADEVRTLNGQTVNPQAFASLADVRNVAEGVQLTVCQLVQTCRHLSAGLRFLEEQGVVREGSPGGPDGVSTALRALLNAEVGLTLSRAALREAAEPLVGLEGDIAPAQASP